MANHVDSYLYFHTISSEGVNKLRETLERFDKFKDKYECHLAYAFVDDLDEVFNNPELTMHDLVGAKWASMHDLVGAKWAYAQDWDEYGISMYSAWSGTAPFVEWLVNEISMVDKSVVAVYNYSDEMPNFTGVQVYTHEGLEESYELDDYEIRELMIDDNEELAALWDEDEETFTDDWELFHEGVWDWISGWHQEQTDEILSFL